MRTSRILVVDDDPGMLHAVERVLGACGGPEGEEAVILVGQRPAPADGHEPGIAGLREDHRDAARTAFSLSSDSAHP